MYFHNKYFNSVITIFILGFFVNGCAMKPLYNKSIVDLRNEAARNYSKQVVEAAAGVLDRSELPVMFSVEGGSSVWNPKYESQFGAAIGPPWSANTTALNPGILASETVVDSMQFNDFGSAATYRLNILYVFLCFPYEIESLHISGGTLFNLFSIQQAKDGLDYATPLSNGSFLGVPKEKQKDFLLFVNDVLNWSRHAEPDILDLSSPPGIVYMFLFKYYDNLLTNTLAIQTVKSGQKRMEVVQAQVDALTAEYQTRLNQALAKDYVDSGYTSALKLLREDVIALQTELDAVRKSKNNAEMSAQTAYAENNFILNKLKRVLMDLAKHDTRVDADAVDETMKLLTQRVEGVNNGTMDITHELKNFIPVGGSGLNADENTDDLYRERFEKLPSSIDTSVIRLNN